ncbi:glutamate receptor ionotropic, kainate 2-like [Euwallacea fornicatus]|uniref:glutamate receptor ionotropic, kainate 2-like n=1 Tax=Euwallacea fornicatus TaxID=995702 RepID=UPI00338DB3B6
MRNSVLFQLCLLVFKCYYVEGAKEKINIDVAIFLDSDEHAEATERAIKYVSNVIKTKTKYRLIQREFSLGKENSFEENAFVAGQKVCEMASKGVAAIFGPESPEINEIVQSVSTALRIPHFQTFWNPKQQTSFGTVFSLHPNSDTLSQAIATLVRDNDWKSYTVIYENEDSLLRLRESLKQRRPGDLTLAFRKLGDGPDYRSVLKQIKASGDYRFILDCKADRILEILKQASEVKLLEDYHSYVLTDLDAHALNWAEFKDISSNISTIRLIDPETESALYVGKLWRTNLRNIKTSTALMYDALNVFITAYRDMARNEEPVVKQLDCDDESVTTEHGDLIRNFIIKPPRQSRPVLGGHLSGPVLFDQNGQRRSFNLQIVEMTKIEPRSFRITGTWKSDKPKVIEYKLTSEEREKEMEEEIRQKNFRVVSRLGAPYLMLRTQEYGKVYYGNDRFEGYSLDLMQEICKILSCFYTFDLVPDGKYGNFDPIKKEWNGLIRHLLDRKADLAVCDLTITYERRIAVDFTMPFMSLGISILYAKSVKEPPELLSFAHPLSLDVWLYMATAYLVISMIIFLVARLNPHDWENPHPCDPNPGELENIWNIRNCCWLTLGSIMTQGCDLLPKGVSTRMATASWWFFSLIMTSSYTANMAAFLTMSRMGLTIESAEDLASQSKIKYGCVHGGSTCSFFKDTNFSTYHQMWVQMESADPTVFESSNADGVKRVLTSKRKYAFLMESTSIEYESERNCDLIQVGGQIDSKGYGIAMASNFQYRKSFNEAILKLQEMGILHRLKNKWWTEMNGGGQCTTEHSSSDETADELDLDNVGGVFVVLAVGVVIALISSICEFLWMVKKLAVKEHLPFKEILKLELRFSFNIWERRKTVRKETVGVPDKNKFKDK